MRLTLFISVLLLCPLCWGTNFLARVICKDQSGGNHFAVNHSAYKGLVYFDQDPKKLFKTTEEKGSTPFTVKLQPIYVTIKDTVLCPKYIKLTAGEMKSVTCKGSQSKVEGPIVEKPSSTKVMEYFRNQNPEYKDVPDHCYDIEHIGIDDGLKLELGDENYIET